MSPDFVTVGTTGDIRPGTLASVDVAGAPIAIANVGGTFYAFGATCTHRQCALAPGDLDGTTVTCPCHGSQFDVTTGAVLTPPAVQPITCYRVRVEDGILQIAL